MGVLPVTVTQLKRSAVAAGSFRFVSGSGVDLPNLARNSSSSLMSRRGGASTKAATSGATSAEQTHNFSFASDERLWHSARARSFASILPSVPKVQATPYALLTPTASASQPPLTLPTTFASAAEQLANAACSAVSLVRQFEPKPYLPVESENARAAKLESKSEARRLAASRKPLPGDGPIPLLV